jgi:surface polysaccharide O-acyltransferase-like enzyme
MGGIFLREVRDGGNIEYLDLLRVLSMLSVMVLHVMAGTLRHDFHTSTWQMANVLSSIMSCSVPIFFMISGAALMNSENTASISYTYKKRLSKLLIPFLLWSFVSLVYFYFLNALVYDVIDMQVIKVKFKNLLSEPTMVHFWFMYAIIPIYMIAPLLKRMVDGMDEKTFRYALILWIFFSSLLPTMERFVPFRFHYLFLPNKQYQLHFMEGYIGYFLLGYYLLKKPHLFKPEKKNTWRRMVWLFLAIVVITLLISVGTWLKTLKTGVYDESFKLYGGIFTLALSVGIFWIFKIGLEKRSLPRFLQIILRVLAPISFAMYLSHNMVVDYLSHKVQLWPASSWLVLLGASLLVTMFCALIVLVLSSVKPLCFMFTGIPYEKACRTCNIQYFGKEIYRFYVGRKRGL